MGSKIEIGASASLSPKEQIDRVLKATDPIAELEKICAEIPYSLPHQEACRLKQEGEKEELIFRCLPTLLVSLERYSGFGVSRKGLFEEGFQTVVERVELWDPEKRLKNGKPDYLRSFVSRNISLSLKGFITKEYGLGVSGTSFPLVCLYRDCWQEFVEKEDRPPTLEEITEAVKLKNRKRRLRLEYGGKGQKINRVAIMYRATQPKVCLEELGQFGSELFLPPPEAIVLPESLKRAVRELLSSLSPIEQRVIELRFGLTDGRSRTLAEVSEELGLNLSVESIRQIEAKALRKFRTP